MPENDLLNGCLEEVDLEFVEREATPQLLMKLSIQLHLAVLSLSNTVSIIEIFGIGRARLTVHNWVRKADLQPESGRYPDHVAVDETVIQLDDEQYWLYAAVDPETNELLHTKLEPTTTKVLAHSFLTELSEKHDVSDVPRNAVRFWWANETLCVSLTPCFSSMDRTHYKMRVSVTASISDTKNMEIGMLSNVSLEK
jgi:transposase-like protein